MFSHKRVKLLSALVGLALSAVLMAGCTPEEISNQLANAARSGAAPGITPTATTGIEKQKVEAQPTQKVEAQQKDDPANHDVNDDKGKDKAPAPGATTKGVNNTPTAIPGVSGGKDDPANHDANDDKGKDDSAKHDVNDDKGKDNSSTPGVSDDKGKDSKDNSGSASGSGKDDKGKDGKSGSGGSSGSGNSGSGKGKK